MTQHKPLIIAALGSLVIIQSVVWEYSRMKPDTAYLVQPWSLRGIDIVHGTAVAGIGIGLLVGAILIGLDASHRTGPSLAVVGMFVGIGTVTAAIVGGDTLIEITIGGPWRVAIILYLAILASRALRIWLPVTGIWRFALFLGTVGCSYLVTAAFSGRHISLSAAAAAALGLIALATAMALSSPLALAASRMYVIATFVAGLALAAAGAAARSSLIRIQAETGEAIGPPGNYLDTQVTWGYFFTLIGAAMVCVGSLAMWAKRRETHEGNQRAAKRLETAERSRIELAPTPQYASPN